MGFFNSFKQPDITQGVLDYNAASGAVLVDVRTPQEYNEGHIPGSVNVPLPRISEIPSVAADRETALFVYCHSGARSRQATAMLQQMGYTNVRNIGGIASYRGKVER